MSHRRNDIVQGSDRLLHITEVKALRPFRLAIEFDDAGRTRKVVDIEPLIQRGGVFRHLRDPELFRSVTIEQGVIYWDFNHGPGYARGIDIAPESLLELDDVGDTIA